MALASFIWFFINLSLSSSFFSFFFFISQDKKCYIVYKQSEKTKEKKLTNPQEKANHSKKTRRELASPFKCTILQFPSPQVGNIIFLV